MVRQMLGATLLSLLVVSAAPAAGSAQEAPGDGAQAAGPAIVIAPSDVIQELVLRDGTRAFGRVVRVEGGRVVFRTTAGGTLEVEAAQIASVTGVKGRIVDGEFLPADSNPTRLFFGPTGRSLPRGSGYFAVYEIMMPSVQFGITDRISVGAGTPPFFGGGSERPFWVTPKLQVWSTTSTQAALGILHFTSIGNGSLGVAYGVVTRGSADSAVTLGAGYAYARSSGDVGGAAVGMIGGEHRVSRRVKLMTENYIFSGGGLASAGVRFLGEHLSADLGLVVPLGAGEAIAFPVVNFVWTFGRD